jgi:hypothetical protein
VTAADYTYSRDEYVRSGRLLSLFQTVHDRYVGFNTRSISKHRTIEFRLYQGTLDYSEIKAWTLLCANIVNIGMTTRHMADLCEYVRGIGAARFLYASAPTVDVQQFIRERLPKEDLELETPRKNCGSNKRWLKSRAA